MNIESKYRSPHFKEELIPVEFAILHYTAQSLQGSLNIFLKPSSLVSCHILIDEEGSAYELVRCRAGGCRKAFHAGKSFFIDEKGRKRENFNNFSLGIELVNLNGNLFKFTERQYESLFELLLYFKSLYPALENPNRILGHEHIAGFRGKKDPGVLFDWPRLFKNVYPQHAAPERKPVFLEKEIQSLDFFKSFSKWSDKKARFVSLMMESRLWPFWLKKIILRFAEKLL